MHKLSLAMVALLASTALGTAALAQDKSDTTDSSNSDASNSAGQSAAEDNSGPNDDMMNRTDDTVYGSARNQADTFEGTIAGDLTADDLLDREVVDVAGESIGEVNDLMIGPDNNVTKAIVDVGGFLGIGAKTVAVEIEDIQFEQGDGGALVLDITREQAEALPEYEEDDAGWRMM